MTVAPTVTFSTVPPSPGTVSLPQGQWIPNIDQITDSAAGILAVIIAGLIQYGLDDDLERILYTHGEEIPVPRTETTAKSLAVSFTSLELGNAGEKRFQFVQGDIGSYAHVTGNFNVNLWLPWPTPSGGIGPQLADVAAIMAHASMVNRAGWVMFMVLRALSLNGVKCNPPITPIQQDGILPGPMEPLGPRGGLAGWKCPVQVQYT